MESHPKVMTVSYGTFSCTLEGFDDPFTTMQVVAEYFRKLSAQDRYFGGEPLQPDHNALLKIAQNTNPYQVDSEVTENGVTLRKAEVVDAPATVEVNGDMGERHADVADYDESDEENQDALAFQDASLTEQADEIYEERVEQPLQFESRRIQPQAEVQEEPENTESSLPEKTIDLNEDNTLVEPSVFASRRASLAAASEEPDQPASKLIEQIDDFSTNDAGIEHVVAELETIKSRIAQEIDVDVPPQNTNEITQAPSASAAIQREDAALERLLETTNSKLEAPGHTRRSNAMQRLKAAVAATEAERRLRAKKSQRAPQAIPSAKVEPDSIRSELGEVRQAYENKETSQSTVVSDSGKKTRGTIATLILGADQRVASPDAVEAAATAKKSDTKAVARDRADSVEATAWASSTDHNRSDLKVVPQKNREPFDARIHKEKFPTFARKFGASTIHELLEASAAYLALVENEPRFSQERIEKNIISHMDSGTLSDNLVNRSLRRLMHDGRILKVKDDSYTISKSARHLYQHRLIG